MTPAQLSEAVLHAAQQAMEDCAPDTPVPASAGLRRPPRGDAQWATGIALRLAGPARQNALAVAGVLRTELLRTTPGVRDVEIAAPGFLNIRLSDPAGADAAVLNGIAATQLPAPWPEDPARDVTNWAAAAGTEPHAGLLVQRESNPLFQVRYAHARSRALLRGGAALGVWPDAAGVHRLAHGAQPELMGLLAEWTAERTAEWSTPGPVHGSAGAAAGSRTPAGASLAGPGRGRRHHRQLIAMAETLLRAATDPAAPVLPSGPEKPEAVHRARLALVQASGMVLADGLYRLGVGAPDHL